VPLKLLPASVKLTWVPDPKMRRTTRPNHQRSPTQAQVAQRPAKVTAARKPVELPELLRGQSCCLQRAGDVTMMAPRLGIGDAALPLAMLGGTRATARRNCFSLPMASASPWSPVWSNQELATLPPQPAGSWSMSKIRIAAVEQNALAAEDERFTLAAVDLRTVSCRKAFTRDAGPRVCWGHSLQRRAGRR
jgi:hypothetical protein